MTKFDPLIRGADIVLLASQARGAACAQGSEPAQESVPFARFAMGAAVRHAPPRGRTVLRDGAVVEEPSIRYPVRFQEGKSQ